MQVRGLRQQFQLLTLRLEPAVVDQLHLEIAGVHLAVSSSEPLSRKDPGTSYAPFLAEACSDPGAPHLAIRLEREGFPDLSPLTTVFATGESWTLYRREEERFLALNPPALAGRIVWLARWRGEPRAVTVHCSNLLLVDEAGGQRLLSPITYPLDQLLVIQLLSFLDGLLLHASGITRNGKAFVFPGRSGAGKSTITKAFLGRDGIGLLSDDRVILRKMPGGFQASGTPWAGEAGVARNETRPLGGVFFLVQARENHIRAITPAEALTRILPVTSIPWYDEQAMSSALRCCEQIIAAVPILEFSFTPDRGAVACFEEAVQALPV